MAPPPPPPPPPPSFPSRGPSSSPPPPPPPPPPSSSTSKPRATPPPPPPPPAAKAPAVPPPPAPSAKVTMPTPSAAPAPAPVISLKPADVPVDKFAAPIPITPPPPDPSVVPTAPESPPAPVPQKPDKKGSKFNKFLKRFRRGDDKPAATPVAPTPTANVSFLSDERHPAPIKSPAVQVDGNMGDKEKIKADRHAAQMAEYEQRLNDWNADFKRKKNQHEVMDLPFNPETEMRPKPTPPAPLEDSDEGETTVPTEEDDAAIPAPLFMGKKRPSSFKPIDTPVVVEGQKASEIAEMFAAKAYGTPMHPAAARGHGTTTHSVSMASMFSVAGPILPSGASMHSEIPPSQQSISIQPENGPHPGMSAPFTPSPANAYQPAPQAFTPHVPQAQYAPPMGIPANMANRGVQMPQVQSNTYVDPALAERIRRGREMTKLGIRSEESGNMGSAKEAYMKALELLIPAIPMLDHGNDISYTFRVNEKRKLNREAGLMLDRCEEIKKFLDGEVAALNTRNLLESAPAPRHMPKKPSTVRQQFYPNTNSSDSFDNDSGEREGGSGDVGMAKRKQEQTEQRKMHPPKLNMPKAPPPPPSNLLDSFSSMGLFDPLSQQAHPRAPISPAPFPAPLPKSSFHRKTGSFDNTRQQAMSRPPMDVNIGHIGNVAPTPATPPTLHMDTACECCKSSPASFMSKCGHKFCAPCMNKAATFQTCLICSETLTSNDFKHML